MMEHDHSRVQLKIKRCIDVAGSSLLLIILSPLFGIIAIAIRLDSRGPVFFNRVRVGKGGSEFLMFKFRTMVPDAEQRLAELQHVNMGGPHMIKIKNDPRVTRVGRLLRTSSADELPQLVNVIVGDMSLVGPRPQAPSEVALYTPEQCQRLLMRPGITGLWQVRSRRSASVDDLVRDDLEYIEHWRLQLDFTIAMKTITMIGDDCFRSICRRTE
jgi:lipopolysaccharide/colanic/teichoic acid biosynthesis glycosyltransferase